MRPLKFLKNLYLISTIILLSLVVAVPFLVRTGISIIQEEYLEATFIIIIFSIAYILFRLYTQEVIKVNKQLLQIENDKKKIEDRLIESFKYIGGINVQIEAIRSMFMETKGYPQNKQEMKQVLKFLSNKILAIISANWILLRIVSLTDQSTLREYLGVRGSVGLVKHHISNKNLIEDNTSQDYLFISSSKSNFNIKTFCIFPKIKINQEQQIMLQAAVTQLEMLFLIFNSKFYGRKNEKYINIQNRLSNDT